LPAHLQKFGGGSHKLQRLYVNYASSQNQPWVKYFVSHFCLYWFVNIESCHLNHHFNHGFSTHDFNHDFNHNFNHNSIICDSLAELQGAPGPLSWFEHSMGCHFNHTLSQDEICNVAAVLQETPGSLMILVDMILVDFFNRKCSCSPIEKKGELNFRGCVILHNIAHTHSFFFLVLCRVQGLNYAARTILCSSTTTYSILFTRRMLYHLIWNRQSVSNVVLQVNNGDAVSMHVPKVKKIVRIIRTSQHAGKVYGNTEYTIMVVKH